MSEHNSTEAEESQDEPESPLRVLSDEEAAAWKERFTDVGKDMYHLCEQIEAFTNSLPPTPLIVLSMALRHVAEAMLMKANFRAREQYQAHTVMQALTAMKLAETPDDECGHG